jgi:hypothetical protein
MDDDDDDDDDEEATKMVAVDYSLTMSAWHC